MNAVSIWIGVGINVLIAGHLGKREQEEANKTVTLGLILFLFGWHYFKHNGITNYIPILQIVY